MNKITSNPSKTLLTLSTGFLIVFILTNYLWTIYFAFIIGLIGIISNKLSILVEKLWFKIAEILGLIIPNILLTIIFFFILFPISMISKIFSKHLQTKFFQNEGSNYISINKLFEPRDFKNPW